MLAADWDRIISRTRQAKYPNEIFVRFVARNYYSVPDRSRVRFLDIGCGVGANSWYLAHEGFTVTALDSSASALASLQHRFEQERFFRDRVTYDHDDAAKCAYPLNRYDCMVDINTLCHVEKVPYLSIGDALKPNGRFFCVMPAHDTWMGTLEGKGFCRTPTEKELRALLCGFSDVVIRKSSYPDGDHNITSWIVEGQK